MLTITSSFSLSLDLRIRSLCIRIFKESVKNENKYTKNDVYFGSEIFIINLKRKYT